MGVTAFLLQSRYRVCAGLGLVLALGASCTAPTDCALTGAERGWIDRSLSAWRLVRAEHLRVDDDATPPSIVFFNERCVFEGAGGSPWRGIAHGGSVMLPDGKAIPPQVASFAAPYAGRSRVFFAMALPSIWLGAGLQSELGLETMMTAVLVHEMTHTRQFAAYTPRLDALEQRHGLGDALNDDIVQDTFRANPDFVAAYEAERDLLYRAAAAPDESEARSLTGTALALMRARRARFFTGEDASLGELEEIFLTMEGIAQSAGFAWLTHPRGAAIAPNAALPGMRRGGRQWSQDEGLAIMLVVDRLVPDWQARAFSPAPATAMGLLALAVTPRAM
jgi:hypothetical protein